MKKLLISIIPLLIAVFSCGPVNIENKEITLKKSNILKKLDVKGYYIEAYTLRPRGFGSNCEAHILITNNNSSENELYVEIQAVDKEKSIIEVANFLIKNVNKNETIQKSSIFNEIKSCSKVKNLNIFAG